MRRIDLVVNVIATKQTMQQDVLLLIILLLKVTSATKLVFAIK